MTKGENGMYWKNVEVTINVLDVCVHIECRGRREEKITISKEWEMTFYSDVCTMCIQHYTQWKCIAMIRLDHIDTLVTRGKITQAEWSSIYASPAKAIEIHQRCAIGRSNKKDASESRHVELFKQNYVHFKEENFHVENATHTTFPFVILYFTSLLLHVFICQLAPFNVDILVVVRMPTQAIFHRVRVGGNAYSRQLTVLWPDTHLLIT